jgi:aspartyl aminopeptidase
MSNEKPMLIQNLITFLNESPTAWHAVDNATQKLSDAGFEELIEANSWKILLGGKYYIKRNGSSLCAFIIPKKTPESLRLLASHTDSPTLKLKPNAEFQKENMIMLGLEVYGGPLLTSWLNRELGIAGRVFTQNKNGERQESLINLTSAPVIIPQLAIHLDRNVNEQGLILNKQEHLSALAAILDNPVKNEGKYLENLLHTQLEFNKLLSHELYLYPLQPARLIGSNKEMIASYRIDSLASVHAALSALIHSQETSAKRIKMILFWDNEEIGSSTAQGASSPFLAHILERILLSLNMDKEEYFKLISKSLCVSIDLAHALNPNYIDKHDPQHRPLLNKGIVLKSNAQHRYASDASTSAIIIEACNQLNLPFQWFISRGDVPCGSTIGPIHSSATGMSTVDIGCAQLSMHSCREIIGCQDQLEMCQLLAKILD